MTKKYLIIAFVISAGVAFGVFSFAPASKTLYIKNSASYLASAENKVGDLSNTIIPSINVPKNLTENFAATLTQDLISKNSVPKTDPIRPAGARHTKCKCNGRKIHHRRPKAGE